MADPVELAFREAARRLIPPGARVLAAVSGGADSVALLHLLGRRAAPGTVVVAHLDHGLRAESPADRRFVEELARQHGWPTISERREVGLLRRRDESPEEAARRVRRDFLLGAAVQAGAERIATGHNLDDQAETVLMRLVRGAGTTALTGMPPAGPGPFVRPLLRIEKEQLREYLVRRDWPYREDPTNADLRFDRNRVRRLVLPLLADHLNRRAARHLVEAAERLRDDAVFLDALAAERFEAFAHRDRSGRLSIDAEALANEPPPLARRLARLALERVGADGRRVSSRHVASLLDLAGGATGRGVDLPGGLVARREKRRLLLHARPVLLSSDHAPGQRNPD